MATQQQSDADAKDTRPQARSKAKNGGDAEFPEIPPVGFGYAGKWEHVPEEAQVILQEQWDELSPKDKAKLMDRTAHHRYDHAQFLKEQ
jgi:hypothetical protein